MEPIEVVKNNYYSLEHSWDLVDIQLPSFMGHPNFVLDRIVVGHRNLEELQIIGDLSFGIRKD
jgi:hypothetical protein